MLLAAERTWGTRCEPLSDCEDLQMQPSSDALDNRVCEHGLAGDEVDRCVNQDPVAQAEDVQQGGGVHAAAEYIRLTAPDAGMHIGGITFPATILEQ
jgi:hypothetical protein